MNFHVHNFHLHLRLVGVHFLTVAAFPALTPLHRHRPVRRTQEWEFESHKKK